MTATVDHLVYLCPELDPAVDRMTELTGVRPAYGGQHPGLGTHNALLALGPRTYLEIIAPDPSQSAPAGPLPFGLGRVSGPELRAWAAAPDDLDGVVERSRAAGFGYGPVTTGQRRTAAGNDLAWRMADRPDTADNGVAPFLIDWADTPHPATTAPAGVTLTELRLSSPGPERLTLLLQLVGLDIPVERAERSSFRAVLTRPDGNAVTLGA
jgi:hypothetical protein